MLYSATKREVVDLITSIIKSIQYDGQGTSGKWFHLRVSRKHFTGQRLHDTGESESYTVNCSVYYSIVYGKRVLKDFAGCRGVGGLL